MTESRVSALIAKPLGGVTEQSVYAWTAKKDMPAHRIGRVRKFEAIEVDECVRRGDADDTAKPSRKEGR